MGKSIIRGKIWEAKGGQGDPFGVRPTTAVKSATELSDLLHGLIFKLLLISNTSTVGRKYLQD